MMKRFLALLLAVVTCFSFAASAHSGAVHDGDTQELAMGPAMLNTVIVDVCEVMDVFDLMLNGVRYEPKVIELKSGRTATKDTVDPHVEAYCGDFRAAQLIENALERGFAKEDLLIKKGQLWAKMGENEKYVRIYDKTMYASKYNYELKGLSFDITDSKGTGHVTLHIKDVSTLLDKHKNDHKWLHQHGYEHDWLHS